MREYSHQITKKQYDYMLPIFGNCGTNKLVYRIDRKVEKYYFIGNYEGYIDFLKRCKYLN